MRDWEFRGWQSGWVGSDIGRDEKLSTETILVY